MYKLVEDIKLFYRTPTFPGESKSHTESPSLSSNRETDNKTTLV